MKTTTFFRWLVCFLLGFLVVRSLRAQNINVQADATTGLLWRPSTLFSNTTNAAAIKSAAGIPSFSGNALKLLRLNAGETALEFVAAGAGTGTVTGFSVVTANGVSATVANPTTEPAATFTLGAITPSSVASTGAISGTTGTFSGAIVGTSLTAPSATDLILSSGSGGDRFVYVTPTGAGSFYVVTPSSGIGNNAGVVFRNTEGVNKPGLFIGTTEADNSITMNASGDTSGTSFIFQTATATRATLSATGLLLSVPVSTTQLTSTISTGTAPFVVASTTQVANLNAATAGSATTAATLSTPRAIYGNNFDGSAALTQVIASTYGGTGNGFTKFTGPTTSEKTFTLPDASATVLTSNAAVTVAQGGTGATTLTGIVRGSGTSALTAAELSGDITTSGSNAATLATVNSNVGTFGSATAASVVTVNGKGLVTAASNTTITPAVGSITGLGTNVGTLLATPSSANLAAAITDEIGTGPAQFANIVFNAQTGTSYEAVASDAGKWVTMSNAAANVFTVPDNNTVSYASGTSIIVEMRGAGATTVSPKNGNVTIQSRDSALKLYGQYSVGVLTLHTVSGDATTWNFSGDIKP